MTNQYALSVERSVAGPIVEVCAGPTRGERHRNGHPQRDRRRVFCTRRSVAVQPDRSVTMRSFRRELKMVRTSTRSIGLWCHRITRCLARYTLDEGRICRRQWCSYVAPPISRGRAALSVARLVQSAKSGTRGQSEAAHMSETPHFDRRRFCAVAAATVAAGPHGLLPILRRIDDMTDVMTEVETSSVSSEIRPFHVSVPQSDLTDLRNRIKATRWPEGEQVTDASQGVQLATMRKLAGYWGTDYDWRKCEAKINAVPNFITEIDGLDIHFIHVKSKEKNALPLIITHGWPGSIIEQMKVIGPLTESHRSRWKSRGRFRCRDSVAARLRVFGQADGDRVGACPHRARVDDADEAPRIHEVRGAGRRLGECVSETMALQAPRNCSASPPTWRRPFRPR